MAKRSLHSKLDGIRKHVVNSPRNDASTPDLPDRYRLLAKGLDGDIISNHAGSYCLVRRRYPPEYVHGRVPLQAVRNSRNLPASAFTPENDPDHLPVRRMLFFDTETTGLGGAGAVAFLVGVGELRPDCFEVRQYLIPDYTDETAMLEALAEEFTDESIIVSYNGAAFDLPIIRDRFIVNRIGRTVPHYRHIDLLHTVHRLFKRRLGDCTLGNVEREVFDFHREDDIPGFLVPSVYFDWLSEQRLDDMEAVMEHNRLDIVSLGFLAVLLAEAFETKGETLDSIDDLHSLARVFGRRRDLDRVLDLNERITDIAGGELENDVLLFHAQAFKRSGEIERAVHIWRQVAETDSREGYLASVQMAMYLEHAARDYAQALEYARRARNWQGLTERQENLVRRRVNRLVLKFRK